LEVLDLVRDEIDCEGEEDVLITSSFSIISHNLRGFSLLAVHECLHRSSSTQATLRSVGGLAFSAVFDNVSS